MLVPTVFGAGACAYAVSTLTNQPILVFGIALVWALVVLTIDRAFLAAYRAGLPAFQKAFQLVLRLTIAILMGLAIAHPLVLLIFEGAVDAEIESEQIALHQEARGRMEATTSNLDQQIATELGRQKELRRQYQQTFEPIEMAQESTALGQSSPIAVLDHQIKVQTVERDLLSREIEDWQKTYEGEVAGEGKTGIPGIGPEARRIRDEELAWRKQEVQRFADSLRSLFEQKNRLIAAFADEELSPQRQQLAAAQAASQLAELEEQRKSREFLRKSLQEQLATISDVVTQMRNQKDSARLAYEEQLEFLPRTDLITRTLALHRLFEKPGGHFAFSAFAVLTLIFVVMDTIPIVVKFTARRGPYDLLVEHQEANFQPESESANDLSVPEESPPPVRSQTFPRWKPSHDARQRLRQNWGRPSSGRVGNAKTIPLPATGSVQGSNAPLDLSEGHVMVKAMRLTEMRTVFRSNAELAEAVGIQPSTLSKYFKLLKVSERIQQQFHAIPELTLEIAYRIAAVADEALQENLIEMAATGASQKAIRDVILNQQEG